MRIDSRFSFGGYFGLAWVPEHREHIGGTLEVYWGYTWGIRGLGPLHNWGSIWIYICKAKSSKLSFGVDSCFNGLAITVVSSFCCLQQPCV